MQAGFGKRNAGELRLHTVDEVPKNPADTAGCLAVARHRSFAVGTATTGRDGWDEHPIADRQGTYRGPGLGDRSNRFMPENPPVGHRWDVALEDVQIRTANGCRVNLHDDVGGFLKRGVRDGFPGLLPGAVIDERLHEISQRGAAQQPTGRPCRYPTVTSQLGYQGNLEPPIPTAMAESRWPQRALTDRICAWLNHYPEQ